MSALEPAPEAAESDEASLLDEHRAFVLGIDDATRRGYSALALGAMVAVALTMWATGTAILSWRTLWLAPLVFFGAVLVGRLTLLARYEARLRERVRGYCGREEIDLRGLLDEARVQGRYEFFAKLFSAARGG